MVIMDLLLLIDESSPVTDCTWFPRPPIILNKKMYLELSVFVSLKKEREMEIILPEGT